MAKNIGKLAGLAALAGAAYMMSKGKGKSDDAGDQKTSSYTGDTKKVGSDGVPLKTPAQSIAAADKSDKSTSISTNGASGTTTPGPDKSVSRLDTEPNKPAKPANAPNPAVNADKKPPKVVSEPSNKSIKLAPERRDLEKNTSRGIPAKQKPASTTSSSAEGMKNYKPRNTPASPAKDTAIQGLKTAVQKTPASVAKPLAATENKFKHEMPITKFFKSVREAGNRGNPDAKMASGGLTASRRGDGIAQRGKTRGKMC